VCAHACRALLGGRSTSPLDVDRAVTSCSSVARRRYRRALDRRCGPSRGVQRGPSGLVRLLQVLLLIGLCSFALLASFRVEDRIGIALFPSRRHRRGLALALIVAADFYLALMLLLARFRSRKKLGEGRCGRHLTIVGGVREARWCRRGCGKTVCTRGSNRALLCGPSTSPLESATRFNFVAEIGSEKCIGRHCV
jgi:hypothetical protein